MGIPVKNVLYMEAMLDACFIPADEFIMSLDGDFDSIQIDDGREPYGHILLDELDAKRSETLLINEQHRLAFYWLGCIGEAVQLIWEEKDKRRKRRRTQRTQRTPRLVARAVTLPLGLKSKLASMDTKELVSALKRRGIKFTVDGRLPINVAIGVQREYGISTEKLQEIGMKLV